MTTPQVKTESIQMTPAAAQMVRELRAEHSLDESFALRIYVAGRGCSGYQYGMALDNKPQQTDTAFENEGVKLLIDEVSIQYMLGSTIDYIDDERGKGFLVDNPNTAPACECGGGGCSCDTSVN
jgi:iron-sulfur cluster insertion protein